MKKRLLGILMAILMVQALLPISVAAADGNSVSITPDYTWYGDGASSEYTISDVGDLLGFANIVNVAKDSFKDKTVYLNSDIDLTGVAWTPIGAGMYDHAPTDPETKQFAGTFDGRNHTITGLSSPESNPYIPLAEDVGNSKEYSFGLFGYAYGANIRNVKLAAVDIYCHNVTLSDDRVAAGSGVAALVGYYVPNGNAPSVIENCHVLSGRVIASNNMGGLLGYLQVYGTQNTIDLTVRDCSNAADVTTIAREAGGILGLAQQSNRTNIGHLRFENCVNTGNICAGDGGSCSVAGGILGQENSSETYGTMQIVFDSCINQGDITVNATNGVGEVHASGIGTGYYSNGPWLVANNCINEGDITVNGTTGSSDFAGGIFAYAPYATIGNCQSTQTVVINNSTPTADLIGKVYNRLYKNADVSVAITRTPPLTLVLNSGTTPNPRYIQDTYFYYPDPIRGGNIFGGWYADSSFTGEPLSSLPNSGTVYAKWTHTSHCLCGATHVEADGEHTNKAFTAISTYVELANAATTGGDFYLADHITFTETVTVAQGKTLNLCLNGCTLSYTGSNSAFEVEKSTLHLTDCHHADGLISGSILINEGTVHIYGGKLIATENAITAQKSKLTVSGGTVSAPNGVALLCDSTSELHLSGAPILEGSEVDISLNANRIVLDAPLTCDDPYTVKSVVNSSSAIVFTNGWSTHMNGKDPSAYFIAYADTITPVKQLILSNGELCLAEKHQIAAAHAENGSIRADKESATVGETVTLTLTPNTKFAVDTVEVFRTGEESATVTVTDNKFTMPDYPVTVRVTFKQVIFDDIALVKLHYGDSTETVRLNIHASPSAKTVEGMVFVGWYDDANLTQRHDFSKPLENNANLYARYITPPKRNRVSFTADGRLIAIVLYRPSQTELTFIPKVPQKEGYVGTWEAYTLNGRNFVVRAVYTKE